jgi:hypothetical protein
MTAEMDRSNDDGTVAFDATTCSFTFSDDGGGVALDFVAPVPGNEKTSFVNVLC